MVDAEWEAIKREELEWEALQDISEDKPIICDYCKETIYGDEDCYYEIDKKNICERCLAERIKFVGL